MKPYKGDEKREIYQRAAYFCIALFLLLIFALPAYAIDDVWEAITPESFIGTETINTVEVFDNYVYLGTNNGLYKSSDYGATWSAPQLTTENITSIVIGWENMGDLEGNVVDNDSPVFVGTDNGVFQNTIGGSVWTAKNTGLDLNVRDLTIGRYYEMGPFILFAPPPTLTFKYDLFAGTASGIYKLAYEELVWTLIDNSAVINLDSNVTIVTIPLSPPRKGYNIFATREDNSLYQYQYLQEYIPPPPASPIPVLATSTEYTNANFSASTLINVSTNQSNNLSIFLVADNDILKQNCLFPNYINSVWSSYNTGLEGITVNSLASDYIIIDSLIDEILYTGTDSGVYKSYDSDNPPTVQWTKINNGDITNDTVIKEVKTDPTSSLLVYAISENKIFKVELSEIDVMLDGTPPADIENLEVAATTATTTTLTWTAPGDDGNVGQADIYDIRYATSSDTIIDDWDSLLYTRSTAIPQIASSTETYTVTGLDGDTTYYFAIKTSDEVLNESENPSNIVSTTTLDNIAPERISDFITVGSATIDSVSLQWTAPGDNEDVGTADRYDIRYSTDAIDDEESWQAATSVIDPPEPLPAGATTTLTVANLEKDTLYFFAMKAYDEANNVSELSQLVGKWTLDDEPPADITDLEIITASTTEDSVTLTWTAPGDNGNDGTATLYDIRYATSTISTSTWDGLLYTQATTTPQIASSTETYIVTGLNGDTTYYFAIKTSDEALNESELSNVVSTTTPDTVAPDDITDLTIITASTTVESITLTWTAPGDNENQGTAETYDIRYSTSTINDLNWETSIPVNTEEPSPAGDEEIFQIEGLQEDTDYYFAIKTSDEVPNGSGLSNILSASTADEVSPSDITDLEIITASTTEDSVTLTWTAPGDNGNTGQAALYDIRYSTADINDAVWDSLAATSATTTPQTASSTEAYTVTGLDGDTTYYFAIKTSDEVPNENESELSNVVSTTTPDTVAPGDIADFKKITATNGSITLGWTATGDNGDQGTTTSYQLKYSTTVINNDVSWDAAASSTDALELEPSSAGAEEVCEIDDLQEDTAYYFALKAYDEADNVSAMATTTAKTTNVQPPPSSNPPSNSSSSGGSTARDNTPPKDVTHLNYQTSTSTNETIITLNWKNPSDNDLSGIMILRRTDKYPMSVNDGTAKQAYKEKGVKNESQSFIDEDTTADITYYYTIYAYDKSNNYSSGVKVIITAGASAAHNIGLNQQEGNTQAINQVVKLIKAENDSKVYVIREGKKHWIPSEAIFNAHGYKWDDIVIVGQDEFESYESGDDMALVENSLIMSDLGPRVYVIKNNKRHWIPSEAIFNSHGFKWDKILKISGDLMLIYEPGEDMEMPDSPETTDTADTAAEITANPGNKPIFAFGRPRLPSLEKEQILALELRQELENNYTKEQLRGINAHNWHTITNSYIYGGYSVKAIVKAIKFGGKTVHPAIPFSSWQNTKDYIDYINK